MNGCEECACGNCNKTFCKDKCKSDKGICIRKTDKKLTQDEFEKLKGPDLCGSCDNCSDENYMP